MKYAISGRIRTVNERDIVGLLNKVFLYKLYTRKAKDENGRDIVNFEAHVYASEDKEVLFNDLKSKVSLLGGEISCHECTHDEENPQPCVSQDIFVVY